MPGDSLSVPVLLDRARAQVGLGDAGEPEGIDNLRRLVDSCRRSAALNPLGAKVLEKVVVRHLVNGLRLSDHLARHPAISSRPPDVAVVITGLPRTGTTLLHKLVALDPAYRVLRLWEALSPVPPDPTDPGGRSERIAGAESWLERYLELVPEMRTIHSLSADGPEECDTLLQNAFASQHLDDMFYAPDYSHWLYRAELTSEYAGHAVQLRVLEDSDSDAERPWMLKSPSHLAHLGTLAGTYPTAVIVQCHRDLTEAVPSWASLVSAVRRPYTDALSPQVVGEQCLQRSAVATERALAVRHEVGDGRFLDVAYRALIGDPVAVVAGIYERMGRPLSREVEGRMRAWVADNPQHQHGRHRYDLAGFGLDEARVRRALAPYVDRFGGAFR
ncbi:MAG: sulfotransferase [Acidimicrobiia bacterium]|nr:sulfotransferase [Acidimicrobiia bacterium]